MTEIVEQLHSMNDILTEIVEQLHSMNDILTVIAVALVLMLVFKQMH